MKTLYTTGYSISYRPIAEYRQGCLQHDENSILLLPGGGDIDASWYGMSQHPTMYGICKELDMFEFEALKEALQWQRPVIAICRGHQLTAVHFGAKLIQDIRPPHKGYHELTFVKEPEDEVGKKLYSLAKELLSDVNSLHHQGVAVAQVPKEAVCMAHHNDVVEMLWYPKQRILSVQFHPEWMGKEGLTFIHQFVSMV